MKTVNLLTQQIQQSSDIKFTDKVILYQQHPGDIIELPTALIVVVDGDATGLFQNGDKILCPLKDFTVDMTVTLAPTFTAGKTYISYSGGLDVDDIGKNLSKKIDISNKVTVDGISQIQMAIEGGELNEFDSGYCDIVVDNSSKYFLSDNNTGLFDNNAVFWLKYLINFKSATDGDMLYFGGLIDLSDFAPDFYNRTITIRAYGHSYEMKRYPAYHVIRENSGVTNIISGLSIIGFTPSEKSEPGVKKLYYKPFNTSKLSGVEVTRVSKDTKGGVKILEFRYPYFFRWNNGDWYKVAVISDTTDSKGELKLYELGGSSDSGYAVIKFGDSNGLNEYPDSDAQAWINVKDEITEAGVKEISNQGSPTLKYDNGLEQEMFINFQRVLKYSASTTLFDDISDFLNSTENYASLSLENFGDELIIVNSEIFFGFYAELYSGFTGASITYQYSMGGMTWSPDMTSVLNGFVDETGGFTASGKVTWGTMPGWSVNDIVVGTTVNYKGFMIRIKRYSGGTGGALSIQKLSKIVRLIGRDNDFLEVKLDQSLLGTKDEDDDVIIKYTKDKWVYGVWYDNLPLQYLLQEALRQSHYGTGKAFLDDMKITKSYYQLNAWGKPPKFNYNKLPTAVCVDFSSEIVYAAVGIEIWKSSFVGLWEKVGKLKLHTSDQENDIEIKRIWLNSTHIKIYYVHEFYGAGTAAYLGKINLTTSEFEEIEIGQNIYSGRWSRRDGTRYFATTQYYRQIGQFGSSNGGNKGENICIPYRQQIWTRNNPSNYALYPAPNLTGEVSGFPEWYFFGSYGGGLAENSGPIYKSNMGFFGLHSNSGSSSASGKPETGFNVSYGNQGVEIVDSVVDDIYVFKNEFDTLGVERAKLRSLSNLLSQRPTYYSIPQVPICYAWDKTRDILFFGFTAWNDEGDDTVSYSYLSSYAKTSNRVADVWKFFHYDITLNAYTDLTTLANTGVGGMATYYLDTIGDCFYIAHNRKFRNVWMKFSDHWNSHTFEYWNGTAWATLQFTNDATLLENLITFAIPPDWAKTTVNGSTQLWVIRVKAITIVSITDYITEFGIFEEILWDSKLSNSGLYESYMPVQLVYDSISNSVHGTLFNRDPLSSNNPFQWVYFVFSIGDDTLQTKNVGINYTYDGTYLLKDFVYDEFNNCVYFMAENIRYQDKPGYMVKAKYNHTGDKSVELTQLVVPRETSYGSMIQLICNPTNGSVFGMTKGVETILWEYSKSFYPRIELAKFAEQDSIYEILRYISQIMNTYYTIHSERKIRFINRENYNGSANLVWNENMVSGKPIPGYWKHKYDSVQVEYDNPFNTEYNGTKKKGFSGWNRSVLRISNPLIQNSHIAGYISDESYTFFSQLRLEIDKIGLIPLIQLELLDRSTINIPEQILYVDKNKYFIVTGITLDSNKNLRIKVLEIKSDY